MKNIEKKLIIDSTLFLALLTAFLYWFGSLFSSTYLQGLGLPKELFNYTTGQIIEEGGRAILISLFSNSIFYWLILFFLLFVMYKSNVKFKYEFSLFLILFLGTAAILNGSLESIQNRLISINQCFNDTKKCSRRNIIYSVVFKENSEIIKEDTIILFLNDNILVGVSKDKVLVIPRNGIISLKTPTKEILKKMKIKNENKK